MLWHCTSELWWIVHCWRVWQFLTSSEGDNGWDVGRCWQHHRWHRSDVKKWDRDRERSDALRNMKNKTINRPEQDGSPKKMETFLGSGCDKSTLLATTVNQVTHGIESFPQSKILPKSLRMSCLFLVCINLVMQEIETAHGQLKALK